MDSSDITARRKAAAVFVDKKTQYAAAHPDNDCEALCGGCPSAASNCVRNFASYAERATFRAGAAASTCCCSTSPVENFTVTGWTDVSGIYTVSLSWDAVPGALSYSITSNQPDQAVTFPTETTAQLRTTWSNGTAIRVTIRAVCDESGNSRSPPATTSVAPCFLAGSLVRMADGSDRPIEDVRVGEGVRGAFGETNYVLALHRPLLGGHKMLKINGEHSTTAHHPHISVDRKFYCADPETVKTVTYGKTHPVILCDGTTELQFLRGLAPHRIQTLTTGVHLKTVEGCRIVDTLELYDLPPETQLYNLVISNSHTYHVDGYAVTGWPREDDFDYDRWYPKY
jgi:hypothetical protein